MTLRNVHRRLGDHWKRRRTGDESEEEAQQLVGIFDLDVRHHHSHALSELRQTPPGRAFLIPWPSHKVQHFRRCLLVVAVIVWILVFIATTLAYAATLHTELHSSDKSSWSLLDPHVKAGSLSTRELGLLATVMSLMTMILLALITRLVIHIRWK